MVSAQTGARPPVNGGRRSRLGDLAAPALLAIGGVSVFAITFLAQTGGQGSRMGLLVTGVALLAAALALFFGAGRASSDTANDAPLGGIAARLEGGIEQLKDLHWELRESEVRYRDMLDHQGDLITRCDDEGRLTFANDAFCSAFGLDRLDALGQPFAPRYR